MTETEEIEEPTKTEEIKEETSTPEEVKETPAIKISSEKDLMRFFQILDGLNPDSQQTMTDFTDMRNIVERSNLATRRDVQLIIYLDMCSDFYFAEHPNNPFGKMRDSIARAFLAKGGFKSKQFVELMRNQPDLSGLQTTNADIKRGLLDRFLGRGTTE